MLSLPGYKITEEVYQSRRTVVYRGTRMSDDIRVLVKLLRTKFPSPRDVAKLKREYEIARELDSRGIVRHYALEPHRNGLALITEDFDAVALSEYLRTNPPGLEECLNISIRLADALMGIHAGHVIHKDIKPRNIVINPESGEIKFIDFGIASRLSRETTSMTVPGKLEGTLAYMSPEQTGRMNRAIDYRSDFYSLGATLYELFTGRLPFASTDPMELVHCQIARFPEPPEHTAHDEPIPPMVGKIIARLMAKTAEERYRGARGLKADLEECLRRFTDTGDIEEFETGREDFSDAFHIPEKLYGREKEIAELMDSFDRVCDGEVLLMLVAGISGVGKSALINEIQKPIVTRRGFFIAGKFDQFKRDVPYSALIQALQELTRRILTEDKDKVLAWKDKLVEAFGPNGRIIIDVIPELEYIVGEQNPVPDLPPTEAQNRFNLVFQRFIRAFARAEHPLTIFLDDLQWADTASLNLIRVLQGDPDAGHLFFIGAYRDNEVNEVHPLSLVLEEIRRSGGIIRELQLLPLKLGDVYRLTTETLGIAPAAPDEIELWTAEYTRVANQQKEIKKAGRNPNSFAPPPPTEEAGLLPEGAELSEQIFKKTDGNPFFVNEFLKNLYQEGLVNFDGKAGRWVWDLNQIKAAGITADVLELMVANLGKLQAESREILMQAACMGNQFDLGMLALIRDEEPTETAGALDESLRAGIILPRDDGYKYIAAGGENGKRPSVMYKFLHDRVHQAAYSLLEDDDRAALHLEIGRLYLKRMSEVERDERLMDIVNHLNRGRDFILEREERIRLARFNLSAGRKAKDSSAYEGALRLFGIAMDLLPPGAADQYYELYMAVHMELGETYYMNSNPGVAEKHFRVILDTARTGLEMLKVYEIKIAVSTGHGQLQEAVEIGREALAALGVKLPAKPRRAAILSELLRTKKNMRKRKPADLADLPVMEDANFRAQMRLLMHIAMPAFLLSSRLFPLVAARMVNLSLKHGNSEPSSYGYAAYGRLLAGELGDYGLADEFGRLALDLVEKMRARELKCRVYYLYAASIQHWKHHVNEKAELFQQAYVSGMETGDLQYVSLCIFQMNSMGLWCGTKSLRRVNEDMEKYNNALHLTNQVYSIALNGISWQYILNMQGGTRNRSRLAGEKFHEDDFLDDWRDSGTANGLYYVYFAKTMLSLLFRRGKQAREFADKALEYSSAVMGTINSALLNYFHSLGILSEVPELGIRERKKALKRVRDNQKRMRDWAAACPENFEHRLLLVDAETARVNGDHGGALKLYDAAVQAAARHGFLLDAGLANELAARYYLAQDKNRFASIYLAEARAAYSHCGLTALVSELDNRFAPLLRGMPAAAALRTVQTPDGEDDEPDGLSTMETVSTTASTATHESSSSVLDMGTVIKASQTLSGEIHLDKLLEKLMGIVMENAGARKAVFMMEDAGRFMTQARGEVDRPVQVLQNEPVEESHDVPISVVNYVERTRENVVLNDAAREGNFREDAYVQEHRVRSVLAAPIISQGKLVAVLYLENNTTSGAFTKERLEVLNILTAQIAVSVENARLYSDIENALEKERIAKQAQIKINEAIRNFVPEDFIKILGRDNIVDVKLGDNIQRRMTVLFSDIRSFTSLSEQMTPEENFRFINSYLGRMGPIVSEHGGFIDKYIGDAVMALFPEPSQAVRAGVDMLGKLLEYNKGRVTAGYDPVRIGIGINTGELMLGTIGEAGRMEGTVISDAVNLAARLEGLTKYYGSSLIVSGDALFEMEDPMEFNVRILDRVQVKGKKDPVSVFEILNGAPPAIRAMKITTKMQFEKALAQYQCGNFAKALSEFRDVRSKHPGDSAAGLYVNRCEYFMEHGTPEDWDGIEVLTEK